MTNWDDYYKVCSIIKRSLDLFTYTHGHEPEAIYATWKVLKFLSQGPELTRHNDGKATLFGLPIRHCAGDGAEFHFAETVHAWTEGDDE